MRLARLLLAPDKFRGTADQRALIERAASQATGLGWEAIPCLISDGGEGLLDLFGGEVQLLTVTGPLGEPVEAEWRLVAGEDDHKMAVIEMARASGLALIGGSANNNPLCATTTGTGELIRSAIEMGATTVIVGCGGSASTDGGLGAIRALDDLLPDPNIHLIVAHDVTTWFTDNARVFGPQKGATPAEIVSLSERLVDLGAYYREHYGVDVTAIKGAGAAGGLAGGLAAVGGKLVPGFDLVADHVRLNELIAAADLVITGEGRLDRTSITGKVVGELAKRCANRVPLLIICGERTDDFSIEELGGATVVSLTERFGRETSLKDTLSRFGQVVTEELVSRSH